MSNPYQTPNFAGGVQSSEPPPSQRVNGPAISLMVTSAIFIAVLLFMIALYVYLLATNQAAMFVNNRLMPPEQVLMVRCGSAVVLILINSVIFYGAQRMKALESYGFAMAAAIIACIPCCGPCYCLGLPFGIWALVVLKDEQVKRAFRS